MKEAFSRTELLLGEEAMERLSRARVAVFGVGGVGGYVCEALVRSGVGAFDLIDSDTVSVTNLNRQIIATVDTVGRSKAEVMRERMLSINPEADVRVWNRFVLAENIGDFPFEEYDYVVDAVDTVAAKLAIILRAKELNVPVISSMGAGNKLDPTRFRVADISKTNVCPLARVMRQLLRKRREPPEGGVFRGGAEEAAEGDLGGGRRKGRPADEGGRKKEAAARQRGIRAVSGWIGDRRRSGEGSGGGRLLRFQEDGNGFCIGTGK